MVGWHPRPFIFVHIPKCGGTSIEGALLPAALETPSFTAISDEARERHWLPLRPGRSAGRPRRQHAKLSLYAEHFPLEQFFTFAVVRNPWDRAVSQIAFLSEHARSPLFVGKPFKEQVRSYCASTACVWDQDLGACQVDWLAGASGRPRVDFIGRFESLADDFALAAGRIGIDPSPPLPHFLRGTRAAPYGAFYDEESAEWIRRRFARDVETFGYRFEGAGGDARVR